MPTPTFIRRRAAVLASAVLSAAIPASAAFAAPAPSTPERPPIEVTEHDVQATNEKVAAAYGALATMWTNDFKAVGRQFAPPRIARYDDAVMTPCGVMRSNNAEFCPSNNTIYYDEVFVAGMAKAVANSLGTDGDMAAVGIIAHEMGHAVAMQLGHEFGTSYQNEATADCLAGAFARQSGRDGLLEKGDVEEAFYGMSLAGDPTPAPTGNPRLDAIIQARLARESHGTKDQRMQNFRTGLESGPGGCLDDFRNIG